MLQHVLPLYNTFCASFTHSDKSVRLVQQGLFQLLSLRKTPYLIQFAMMHDNVTHITHTDVCVHSVVGNDR